MRVRLIGTGLCLLLLAAAAGCAGTTAAASFHPGGAATGGDSASGGPVASALAPAGASASASGTPSTAASAPAPGHFATLPAGAALPTDSQCAAWVRARPITENKPGNATANQHTGQHIGADILGGDDARANRLIAPRVDGGFAGTTGEILRWVACKWGIDEDIVFAQAAVESWWRQSTKGDFDTDVNACPPGHGLGVDGTAGKCPQSYGILQTRYPYMKSGWPGIADSTAMSADLAYGIWRACFEGYETWLNTVEQGQRYAAGDAWGCVGRWFSGRWHTAASDGYVTKVRDSLDQKVWQQPNFAG
jgi:autotransporter family porin